VSTGNDWGGKKSQREGSDFSLFLVTPGYPPRRRVSEGALLDRRVKKVASKWGRQKKLTLQGKRGVEYGSLVKKYGAKRTRTPSYQKTALASERRSDALAAGTGIETKPLGRDSIQPTKRKRPLAELGSQFGLLLGGPILQPGRPMRDDLSQKATDGKRS